MYYGVLLEVQDGLIFYSRYLAAWAKKQQKSALHILFWPVTLSWKPCLDAASAEGGMREQEAAAIAYREGSHGHSSHHLPSPVSLEATWASAECV